MKSVAILYSKSTPTIDAIVNHLHDCRIECLTELPKDYKKYDLIVAFKIDNCRYKNLNFLKCHYSLLPSFATDEPVKDAFIAGVKVTGITIYYTNPHKIIFQYPLIIRPDAHFDEIEQELEYLEQIIYPKVIENILNNIPCSIESVFQTQKKTCLNNTSCCSKCKGGECDRCKN